MKFIRKIHIAIFPFLVLALYLPTEYIYAKEQKPIKLLEPELTKGKPLMTALKERRTERSFTKKELPLEVLSNLLWAACGVNRPDSGKRTAPSAMNMQEIDIYVAMKDGLYLYKPSMRELEPVMEKDIRKFTGEQDFTEVAPVNLIYVADFSKMRGDIADKTFYAATDTGFISQNVYLFCASEGLATVVIGWVDKKRLSEAMNLREEQKVILTQPVGYPR